MERDWESLLEELWGHGSSDPVELETRIRACLRGHSSEGLLQAISLLISQKQHSTARTLLSEFLRSHHAAHDIRRRLALILDCEPVRTVKTLSLESKQRSKEILLKDVNDLVAAGDLRAAETILLNASKSIDEPDYLSLLGRIYVLQERPLDAAKVVKGELLLRRQQRAFVEKVSVESEDDNLPTAGDLSYLNDFASSLASLEPSPATTSQSSTAVEKTLDFSQQASAQVPPFSWDDLGGYRVERASVESSARAEQADAVDDLGATQRGADSSSVREITVECTPKKSILKLARPRKPVESGATQARVPIFKKPTRSLGGVRALASSSPAADTDGHPDLPPKTESSFESPQIHDDIFDEYDDLPHAYPEVDSTYLVQRGGSLEESEDETDFDHDLHDLTIIELGKEYEEDASIVLDDFRDLGDDYVAYAFDPDEVFDSQEIEGAESDSWLADTLSREDRALQKAAELISNADWPLSTLPLIQQIFVMSGWGATRLALAREIEKGLTPEELILAAHIKVMWAENDIYWIAFDKTGSSRLSYYVLSWPTALLIVRSFESLPQVEEIEVFLEHLFTSWYENYTLRRVFKAFARYIWFRFANLEGCLPAKEHFDFCDPSELPAEEYSDLGLCDTLDIEMTARLRVYGVYQNKHPQEPSCYFSDKPIVAEEEPSLDASAKGKRVKRAPEATETELKAGDDTSWADDVDDEENSPQLSAALLAAAVNTQIADKPSTSIES